MANVKQALEDLKKAMFNPTEEERKRIENRYCGYSLSQLNEIVEELENELDRLPPYAIGRLNDLCNELQDVTAAIGYLVDNWKPEDDL